MAATNLLETLKPQEKGPLSLDDVRLRLLHSARKYDRARLDLESPEKSREGDLDWLELAEILPDGAFPSGVVELASPNALGGSTAVAFAAIRSVQKKTSPLVNVNNQVKGNLLPNAIPAAWIDTDATLHAPGAHRAGIDLARLFVVRPPRSELGRIAVKVARSGAFELLVIDVDPIFGLAPLVKTTSPSRVSQSASIELVVRKLALAAEANGMTVMLITDAKKPRAVPWPVAMRLELERQPGKLGVRVAKERHGRIGAKAWISLGDVGGA